MSDTTTEAFCPACDAEQFPAEYGEPGGGGHYTIRNAGHWFVIPYLAGVRQGDTEECLAGADGWIVQYAVPPVRCPRCAWEPLRTITRGAVTIEDRRELAPRPAPETAAERRVRELADDIRLVLVPRIVTLTDAAARAGDRERLKRIQTSLVTRIGKETG